MEDFGQLEKIITETIKHAFETKHFNFGEFLQQMESGFKNLGFRDAPDTRGGAA